MTGAADGATRWALLVEYDGTPFVGWQRQATGVSVQSVLEQAASRLVNDAAVAVTAAGRTDAGVHAAGQVAHLDLPTGLIESRGLTPKRLRDALNFHMRPHPIAVVAAAMVPPDWSARFSANRRRYLYRILNRPARPALERSRVWHVKPPLDPLPMREAAAMLVGRHDFTSFRATACQAKSPLRTLDRLELVVAGGLIEIHAEARSFLHHQVRNMVGTLKLVGEGRWQPGQVATALAALDRAAAGPTAPADGLFLMEVGYAQDPFAETGLSLP
ncbi:tRNA pseudouridine(38-40) synthase TruA [Lichenicola sp.]|uniref:tRNA pseudouridine(38-40) synthase TruA n=1 Tax=Lichenicola sp. TaxID=2804529 RepID=UPI003AFFF6D0